MDDYDLGFTEKENEKMKFIRMIYLSIHYYITTNPKGSQLRWISPVYGRRDTILPVK
jgi:hypothetical protein